MAEQTAAKTEKKPRVQKVSAHVLISNLASGKWTIDACKLYVGQELVAKPSRKLIDEMVKDGKLPEKYRQALLTAGLVSEKATGGGKAEPRVFANDTQKKVWDLFVRGSEEFGKFIKSNPILQEIAKMDFIDPDTKEKFKVVPSHYLSASKRAIASLGAVKK